MHLVNSPGAQILKLSLLFLSATSGAVLLAVALHRSGTGDSPANHVGAAEVRMAISTQAPAPIIDLDGRTVALQSRPVSEARVQPAVAVRIAELTPADQQAVVSTLPVREVSETEDEPPVTKALPISLTKPVADTPPEAVPATDALQRLPPPIAQLAIRTGVDLVNNDSARDWAEPGPVLASLTSPQTAPSEPFGGSMLDSLRGAPPAAVPIPMVYQAVLLGDNEWLKQLLDAGFAVNELTPGGDTALCAAVKARNTTAVELLVLRGADPNQEGRDGQTPLGLACLLRTERVIPALLKAGADANTIYSSPVPDSLLKLVPFPDLKDSLQYDRGVTALMAVAARGDVEGTIALLEHGAKPDQPTKRRYAYPINFAAEQGYLFIMRLLLGRPADSEPDVLVRVDLSEQRAYLSKQGEVIDKTTVSTGREGYATPEGRYVVTDKHTSWTSNLYHVEMPYFMRLNCSAIGLHAGYVTGSPASHGCIRLPYDKVKKWFGIVKIGDEVQITR